VSDKTTYIVEIDGLPVKVYAASKSQALMAKEHIERTHKKPDLSPEAQQERMKEALTEARKKK
jgi:hypothetical protein